MLFSSRARNRSRLICKRLFWLISAIGIAVGFFFTCRVIHERRYLHYPVYREYSRWCFTRDDRCTEGVVGNECPIVSPEQVHKRIWVHYFLTHYDRLDLLSNCLLSLAAVENTTSNIFLHIGDFPSLNCPKEDVLTFLSNFGLPYKYYEFPLPFSKALAMKSMLEDLPVNHIGVAIDADFKFSKPFADCARYNTIAKKQFYAPIILLENKAGQDQWCPNGSGISSFFGSDVVHLGGYSDPHSQFENKTVWGHEETAFTVRAKRAGIDLCRAKHPDILHVLHDRPKTNLWYSHDDELSEVDYFRLKLVGGIVISVLLLILLSLHPPIRHKMGDILLYGYTHNE